MATTIGMALSAAPAVATVPLRIESEGCEALDASLLERLTRLELAAAALRLPDLGVSYSCGQRTLTIRLANAANGIGVERRVRDDWDRGVEPERTAALLAAGLYRAGEAVLAADASSAPSEPSSAPPLPADVVVLTPPNPAPTVLPTAPRFAPVAAPAPQPPQPATTAPGPQPLPVAPVRRSEPLAPTNMGRDTALEEPAELDRKHELRLAAAARGHNVDALLGMMAVGLHYRYWLMEELGIGPLLEAEFGSAQYDGGAIDARLFQLGAALDWKVVRYGPFRLVAEAFGAAMLVQLEGDPMNSDFQAATIEGVTGNLGAQLVPSLGSAATQVGLALGGGYLFRAPRGQVGPSEEVQIDGIWLSAGLCIHLGLGQRAAKPVAAARSQR
jgi:hypothetical protein